MPDQPVISNTSPLFYLHAVGRLDLLRELFGQIIIPPAVVEELAAGAVRGYGVPDIAELAWIDVRPPDETTVLEDDLGAGETEAIALALEIPGSLLILDDFAARQVERGVQWLQVGGDCSYMLYGAQRAKQQIGDLVGK